MPLRGLGDLVAVTTKALGIKQNMSRCRCAQRQAKLNEAVPFDRRAIAEKLRRRFRGRRPERVLPAISGGVAGEEARCTALGSNCVCSEPFQMTGFTHSPIDPVYWIPNDSTRKCGSEVAQAPIIRHVQDLEATTDATALSRLPLGHSVSRFLRAAPGNDSMFFIGGNQSVSALGSQFMKRLAVRGYVYHSPDYNFRDDTPPCHSKFMQGEPGAWHWENFTGPIHMYDFFGTNWGRPPFPDPFDCCFGNPGAQYQMQKNDWRGHWIRAEAVLVNRAGGASPNGVWHRLYLKDVSRGVTLVNGGNEFVASDWRAVDMGGPMIWSGWDNITSSPPQLGVNFNFYREVSAGGGQCNGWRGITHMMIAGWDTDANQRIGPAAEVEGGGVVTPAPPVVTITGPTSSPTFFTTSTPL